jgi:hypothetical protein
MRGSVLRERHVLAAHLLDQLDLGVAERPASARVGYQRKVSELRDNRHEVTHTLLSHHRMKAP